MKALPASLALAVLVTANVNATPAAAQESALADFTAICHETGAQREAVVRVACGLGYRAAVPQGGGQSSFDTLLHSPDMHRTVTYGDGEITLSVSGGSQDSITLRTAECGFGNEDLTQEQLTRLTTDWVGRQAARRDRYGDLEWRYTLDADLSPLPAADGLDLAALERGPIVILTVFETAPGNVPIIRMTTFWEP